MSHKLIEFLDTLEKDQKISATDNRLIRLIWSNSYDLLFRGVHHLRATLHSMAGSHIPYLQPREIAYRFSNEALQNAMENVVSTIAEAAELLKLSNEDAKTLVACVTEDLKIFEDRNRKSSLKEIKIAERKAAPGMYRAVVNEGGIFYHVDEDVATLDEAIQMRIIYHQAKYDFQIYDDTGAIVEWKELAK